MKRVIIRPDGPQYFMALTNWEAAVEAIELSGCSRALPYGKTQLRTEEMLDRWHIPATPFAALQLDSRLGAALNGQRIDLQVDEHFYALCDRAENALNAQRFKTAKKLPQPRLRNSDLWQHQLNAYYFLNEVESGIFAGGVGVGKTKTVIDLFNNRGFKRVLVVCPAHIIRDDYAWPEQFIRHSYHDYRLVKLRAGSSDNNLKLLKKELAAARSDDRLIFLVNYESFWRGSDRRDGFGAFLLQAPHFDAVYFDECHKLKSPSGMCSRFAARFANKYRSHAPLWGMTGTVLPHSPLDAFGQFRVFDPGIFGTSYSEFRARYADVYMLEDVPLIKGYINQDELAEKMSWITIEISSDVLGLRPPQHLVRSVTLNSKERKAHDDLEMECALELEEGILSPANAMVKSLRLAEITGGHVKLDQHDHRLRIGTSKLDELRSILEDELPGEDRIVVFVRFTCDLMAVKEASEKADFAFFQVGDGLHQLAEWRASDKKAVLGINVKSGEGVDLTIACYGIFYSKGYSRGELDQCCGRMQRPGQKRWVHFIHLVAKGTIDQLIDLSLQASKDATDVVIKHLRQLARQGRKAVNYEKI